MARSTERIIELEKTKVLSELLNASGLQLTGEETAADVSDSAVNIMELLEGTEVNRRGASRIVVGRAHIALRAIVWETVTAALGVIPSVVGAGSGAHVSIAAGAFIKSLFALTKKVSILSDEQLLVCNAVATISAAKRKQGRVLTEPGATVEEIRSYLSEKYGFSIAETDAYLQALTPAVLTRTPLRESAFFQLVP